MWEKFNGEDQIKGRWRWSGRPFLYFPNKIKNLKVIRQTASRMHMPFSCSSTILTRNRTYFKLYFFSLRFCNNLESIFSDTVSQNDAKTRNQGRRVARFGSTLKLDETWPSNSLSSQALGLLSEQEFNHSSHTKEAQSRPLFAPASGFRIVQDLNRPMIHRSTWALHYHIGVLQGRRTS